MSRSAASLPADPAEMAVCTPVHQDGFLLLAVRLQHLWGEFCRELVIRSAIGGCVTRTGLQLLPAPEVKRVSDLPTIARRFSNRSFTGPGSLWEVPSIAIGRARSLQVANYHQISLGLSAVNVIDYLKPVRNFIVHPSGSSISGYSQAARSLGFPGLSPIQLLSQRLPGGGTIFDDWVSALEIAAWNAVA